MLYSENRATKDLLTVSDIGYNIVFITEGLKDMGVLLDSLLHIE